MTIKQEGGASAPPFAVGDVVRYHPHGMIRGRIVRVSDVEPPFYVQWNDKHRTTGWYYTDELAKVES